MIDVSSLAASTLIVTVAASLFGRVGFAMTRGVAIKLACFNAFGEMVSLTFSYAWETKKQRDENDSSFEHSKQYSSNYSAADQSTIPDNPLSKKLGYLQQTASLAKHYGVRFLAYGTTSLLTSKSFNPIFISASVFNATVVSCGEKLGRHKLGEVNVLKKLMIAVALLAASTSLVIVAAPLLGRVGFAITRGGAIKLACFNVFGEAVLFALPILGKYIKGFKIDHKDPEIKNEFNSDGVNDHEEVNNKEYEYCFIPPKLPSTREELLHQLTDKDILYICEHFGEYAEMSKILFTTLCEKFNSTSKDSNITLPKSLSSVDQINSLNAFQVRYILENFNQYIKMNKTLFTAFCEKFNSTSKDSNITLPKSLSSVDQINSLNAFQVRYILENLTEVQLNNCDLAKELNNRFYEQNLFPPMIIKKALASKYPLSSISNNKRLPFIDLSSVTLPKTRREVAELSTIQLIWIFAATQNGQTLKNKLPLDALQTLKHLLANMFTPGLNRSKNSSDDRGALQENESNESVDSSSQRGRRDRSTAETSSVQIEEVDDNYEEDNAGGSDGVPH